MGERRNNYVVGFEGNHQVVYGRPEWDGYRYVAVHLKLMTLARAKKEVLTLGRAKRVKRVIYKLVPVESPDA